jgi:hypothetical protein
MDFRLRGGLRATMATAVAIKSSKSIEIPGGFFSSFFREGGALFFSSMTCSPASGSPSVTILEQLADRGLVYDKPILLAIGPLIVRRSDHPNGFLSVTDC